MPAVNMALLACIDREIQMGYKGYITSVESGGVA